MDFSALGIKYIRVTAKSTGPIRMAILNTITDENEEKKLENAGAGSEPGVYVDNSDDYKEVLYDMTPSDYGFKGAGAGLEIDILDWVNRTNAPEGALILKAIKGLKWEVKDAKGGIGEISIKAVEFLDASKTAIDPVKLTGMEIKPVSLYKVSMNCRWHAHEQQHDSPRPDHGFLHRSRRFRNEPRQREVIQQV